MRIAFIGQKGIPAHGGGIERYAEDLSVRIAATGHDVIAYTRPHYTDKNLNEYKGVKLVSIPSLKTKHLDTITHVFLACLDAARKKVDVIHFQNIGPTLMIWVPKLLSPRTRIVSTLQSQDYKHKKWGLFARFSLHLGEYLMCKLSDEVIVVTEHIQKHAMKKYGIDTHLIPNGANAYEPLPADSINSLGLEKDSYIAYLGRLVRHKGIHYLIEAFKQVDTDKTLVIAGSGAFTDGYVDELYKMAEGHERIRFIGNQEGDTLKELYSNTSLFVLPSESEGLSLALLEAMSIGTPILASDIPENLEGLKGTGYTFVNKDVEDLKIKLQYILDNPHEAAAQAKAAKHVVSEHFDWDKIAMDILEVYKKTILDSRIASMKEVKLFN